MHCARARGMKLRACIPTLLALVFLAGCTGRHVPETPATVTVGLNAPSPAWSMTVDEAWVVGDEAWVLAELHQKQGGASAQVITPLSATVALPMTPSTLHRYVVGRTWTWPEPDPSNSYVPNVKAFHNLLPATARQVYPRP